MRYRLLRYEGKTELLGIAIILMVLLLLSLGQCRALGEIGNGLSPTADPWTEADTLRAGEAYSRYGYLANAGLPDLVYGEQFSSVGTKSMLHGDLDAYQSWVKGTIAHRPADETVTAERFIYTHYPPGPHLILGMLTSTFGVGSVMIFRLVPVVFGLFSIAYLALELVRYFGAVRTSLLLAFIAAFPMLSNMMHGLSYQGYALSALQIELALVLRAVRRNKLGASSGGAMFALGFFQGWLGFDYAFLVVLSPMVVWLLHTNVRGLSKLLFKSCIVVATGYALALGLHFLQVVAYFGSGHAAIADLFGAADYRATGGVFDDGSAAPGRLAVLWSYLTTNTGLLIHFNVPMLAMLVCSGLMAWVMRQDATPLRSWLHSVLKLLIALLVSSIWVVVMPQHSAQHWHFIPRHYFLFAFFAVLMMLNDARCLDRARLNGHSVFELIMVAPLLAVILLLMAWHADSLPVDKALVAPVSLFAYVITAVGGFCLLESGFLSPKKVVLCFPPAFLVALLVFMCVEGGIESSGTWSMEFVLAKWIFVALPALIGFYGLLLFMFYWKERLDESVRDIRVVDVDY